MAATKLDPNTPNNEIGIFIERSGRLVALDTSLGEVATVLKTTVAGNVVYKNGINGDVGEWPMEAGGMALIFYTEILTSGFVKGVERFTTVPLANIWWGITPLNLGSK